jgi:hypothetical protein
MLNSYGVQAARDYLLAGHAIIRLEAMVLFAVPDLTKIISDLRSAGHDVQRQVVPLARAIRRVNEAATLVPPASLPVSDIQLTEYWIAS